MEFEKEGEDKERPKKKIFLMEWTWFCFF